MTEREASGWQPTTALEVARFLRFGPFRLDRAAPSLRRNGVQVHLPPRCHAVLRLLAQRPGELVSKEEILEHVWDGTHVTEDALIQAVSRIRQTLADDPRNPTFIQTVHRQGYRFVGEVSAEALAPARLSSERAPASPSERESRGRAGPTDEATSDDLRSVARPSISRRRWLQILAVSSVGAAAGTWAGSKTMGSAGPSTSHTGSSTANDYRTVVLPGRSVVGGYFALSPTRSLVFAGIEGDTTRLFFKGPDDYEPRPLPGTEGAFAPFFSWDGRLIAFFKDEWIWKLTPDDPRPRQIARTSRGDSRDTSGSWGPDGTIVYGSIAYGLKQVREGDTEATDLLETGKGPEAYGYLLPRHLPDGKLLFCAVSDYGSTVCVLDSNTRKWKALLRHCGSAWHVEGAGLYYVDRRSLMKRAIDLDSNELQGKPALVETNIASDWAYDRALAAVSRRGDYGFVPRDTALEKRRLFRFDRRQGAGAHPEPIDLPARGYVRVRVSPDGGTLALTLMEMDEKYVWTMAQEVRTDSRAGRLPTSVASARAAIWSRSGGGWLLVSRRGLEGEPGSFAVRPGSRDAQELVLEPFAGNPQVWDKERGWLVVQRWIDPGESDGGWRIEFVDLANRNTREPTTIVERGTSASVSPDGNWIAYAKVTSGIGPSVYVNKFPEGGAERAIAVGDQPAWSPARDEILYVRSDQLFALPVTTAGDFRLVSQETRLFGGRYLWQDRAHRAFDVALDGTVYVIGPDESDRTPEIRMVLRG